MAGSRRLAELAKSASRRAVFPAAPWVVALSGGADSGTLAWLAVDRGGLESCVHVHHGLEASDRLAVAAEEMAAQLGVQLTVEKVRVPSGPSPENMARTVRYEAFSAVAGHEKPVLLGHTKDDQAETVLLNLTRGGGSAGSSGIPYHRPPNFFRPLLDVGRAECRELATLAGLPFFDDPSNQDRSIRRNRIRLDILPMLEEINPNVVDSLARFASHIGADVDLLNSMVDFEPLVDGDSRGVPAAELTIMNPALMARTLRDLVSGMRAEGLTTDELGRISSVVSGDVGATEIEGGIRAERRGPIVWLTPVP